MTYYPIPDFKSLGNTAKPPHYYELYLLTLAIYRQIRYHEHNTVRIKTIDNQRADTRYLLRNQIRRMDEEIRTAAEVIAEVQIDSPSSDVVLTANGYANKAALKNALVNIDYDCMKDVLEFMLRDGAYVYKAVCQQEVVGVVVIIQLTREFSMPAGPSGTSSPQGLSFPLLDDLDAVEAYARSSAVDHEVTCQLRSYLNSRLRHHGIGKLWGKHLCLLLLPEYNFINF